MTTTVTAGLRTTTDQSQLAFVCQEQRVLVTHDQDFLIIASQTSEHAGIVYCKQQLRSIGKIIEGLTLIHAVYSSEEMIGRVEYL